MRPLIRLTSSFYCINKSVINTQNHYKVLTSTRKFCEQHNKSKSQEDQQETSNFPNWSKTVTLVGVGSVLALTWTNRNHIVDAFSLAKNKNENINKKIGANKIYTRQDVAQHNSIDRGVWITFRGNVYDITEFIKHHPGGSQTIMMGAGGDVEPFWKTYTVHNASEVQNLLSQYQIGILDPLELMKEQEVKSNSSSDDDPYSTDPKRSPLLEVLSEKPFNAETPGKLLPPTYLTPTEIFFVRNHLPVPEVDPDEYRLSICFGSDGNQENLKVLAEFSLEELKKNFVPHSVDCVIQCSGNRRSDLKKFKEIKGLNWKIGAIGNAKWTGIRLIDLLESLGISEKEDKYNDIKHIQLEGLDCDMSGQSYGASISSDLAFDRDKSVLLAYEMNGQPLTRDHGFPLRLIAPGVTGARNVKWLSKIILSHEESHSHWQRKDYKSFSPNVDMFNVNFDESASVQETPVQSAICDPQDGDEIVINLTKVEKIENENSKPTISLPVIGYAFSGGGKMIVRVDVSIDGGNNWITANLNDVPKLDNGLPDYTDRNQTYSWTRWSVDVLIPIDHSIETKTVELLCRAFDSSYNSQPERAETIWNVRGVMNNSWHKIKLKLNVKRQ